MKFKYMAMLTLADGSLGPLQKNRSYYEPEFCSGLAFISGPRILSAANEKASSN